MTCEPYSAVECKPVTNKLCVLVQWEEYHQEVQPICTEENIDKPRQLVSHKKLCLLPDTQTKLPNGPLQPLKPKEKLEQNVFPDPRSDAKIEFPEYETEYEDDDPFLGVFQQVANPVKEMFNPTAIRPLPPCPEEIKIDIRQ